MSNKINRITTLSTLTSTKVPVQTNTYKPLSHKELDQLTRDALSKNGFEIESTTFLSAKDGMQATGQYRIKYGDDPDMGLMLAWQNSYDKIVTAKFAIGGYVFVYSNGVVVGDLGTFSHKHNGDIQTITPSTIEEFVSKAGEIFAQMVIDKEAMKQISISKKCMAELLGRMYIDEEIITVNQLSKIKGQIKLPSFTYGEMDTVWTFLNHITYVLKEAHPKIWMSQHINAYKFIKLHFGI